MLFQYQGLADPLQPLSEPVVVVGPDQWGYAPQVPVRRALAAAVAVFLAAPGLVPVDASQFVYPTQTPVQRVAAAREGYTLTAPVLVPQDASQFEYPAQVAIRAPRREQPTGTVAPFLPLGTTAALGYPTQRGVRQAARSQPAGTVCPFPVAPVFDSALLARYPAQVPVRRLTRPQPQSTVKPPLVEGSPVTDTVYVDLTPEGGCPGTGVECLLPLAFGPVRDRALLFEDRLQAGLAFGPVRDRSLLFGAPHVG